MMCRNQLQDCNEIKSFLKVALKDALVNLTVLLAVMKQALLRVLCMLYVEAALESPPYDDLLLAMASNLALMDKRNWKAMHASYASLCPKV